MQRRVESEVNHVSYSFCWGEIQYSWEVQARHQTSTILIGKVQKIPF